MAPVGFPLTDSCWPWQGTTVRGYGRVYIDGSTVEAHRFIYQLLVGPIPTGLEIDHLCHNRDPECAEGPECLHRRCVNPAHLEPVTHRENMDRAAARRTRCRNGHPRTPENTLVTPTKLVCRVCNRERVREYKARLEATS